jgi:hypothetical protein
MKIKSLFLFLFSIAIISCSENNSTDKKSDSSITDSAKQNSASSPTSKDSAVQTDLPKQSLTGKNQNPCSILNHMIDTSSCPGFYIHHFFSPPKDNMIHYKDSTCSINVAFYQDKYCRYIYITDKKKQQSDYYEFYMNGQLKLKGAIAEPTKKYIGQWKYYSFLSGKDSILDADKKYKVSYFRVLDQVNKLGWKFPSETDIYLEQDSGKVYWVIYPQKTDTSGIFKSPVFLKIDVHTGEQKLVHQYVVYSHEHPEKDPHD